MENVHIMSDSGVVDLEDLDNLSKYPYTRKTGQKIRTVHSYKVYGDSLNLRVTETFTGINRHSGKRWFKYRTPTNYSFKVRELKSGKKFLFIWKIPENRKSSVMEVNPSSVSLYMDEYSGFRKELLDFCLVNIGPLPPYLRDLLDDSSDFAYTRILNFYCKPNLLLFKNERAYLSMEENVLFRENNLSLRNSTYTDIFKKLLGKKYSKKLASTLSQRASAIFVKRVSTLPDSIPVDWLVDLFSEELIPVHSLPNTYMSSLYDDLVPKSQSKKMLKFFLSDSYGVRSTFGDVLHMIKNLNLSHDNYPKYNDLFKNDLYRSHRLLSNLSRQKEEERLLEPLELPELPDPVLDLGFSLPTMKKDLYDWSMEFSNCVSSYCDRVADGTTLVLRRGSEACIEIRNGSLKQYLGKNNSSLSPEKFWEGVDILLEHGMIKEQPNRHECWGFQPQLQKEVSQ